MEYKKHVGIYSTEKELQDDLINLVVPWVAYVSTSEGGFKVYYSDDITLNDGSIDGTTNVMNRLQNLEQQMVTLTEEEYEKLIVNGKTTITEVDGKIRTEIYNPSRFYYTYDPSDKPNE